MKSPMLLNVTFFFVFALLATTLPSASAHNVLDVDGNPMRSGRAYYILPAETGSGGGTTLGKTGNDTCSLNVVQASSDNSTGLPVEITDFIGNYYIQEIYATRMEFVGNDIPSCVPSPASWVRVGQYVKVAESYSEYFSIRDWDSKKYTYYLQKDGTNVTSINKTLVVSDNGSSLLVKFKRDYSNSRSDTWSIV